MELRMEMAMKCAHCGKRWPNEEKRIEMALCGVENPCPKCGQPMPEPEKKRREWWEGWPEDQDPRDYDNDDPELAEGSDFGTDNEWP